MDTSDSARTPTASSSDPAAAISTVPAAPVVVVGIDDSPSARAALSFGADYARAHGLGLRAVHVIPFLVEPPMAYSPGYPSYAYLIEVDRDEIHARLDVLLRSVDPEPEWELVLVDGSPGAMLIEQSRDAALLVLGTHEHVGWRRIVTGSVSHYCLSHAGCPIAAIPSRATPHQKPSAVPSSRGTGHDTPSEHVTSPADPFAHAHSPAVGTR